MVFRHVATLCAASQVNRGRAETQSETGEALSLGSIMISSSKRPWQAVAAQMDDLPARSIGDREQIMVGVCVLDNNNDIFQIIGPTGQVYRPERILLDSGAQPLMF